MSTILTKDNLMVPLLCSFPPVNTTNAPQTLVAAGTAETTGAGLSPVLSWTAFGVIVTAIGVTLVVLFRRRDTRTKTLTPGYDAAGTALVLLNRLATKLAVTGVTDDLKDLADLVTLLTIADARSPKIGFGTIVSEVNGYLADTLPQDYAVQLAANPALADTYFALVRNQGIKLEAARIAIVTVQRRVEKLTRK
ncbi:hypothetical protein ABT272_36655 [Streptomyces sp900105245]|uniref:DUF4129 domain-containing protein n=1 Tax=Streptomyces sp. 900105245 TaxID=3154379 RepID=A0ABV1UIU8_9ACTN